MNNARFVIQISKGLIRDQRARRMVMFYSVIVALVLIFAGSIMFSDAWAHEHPFLYIGYWAGCAWITLLAVLLAFYDIVKVRADVRRERRRLERELIEKAKIENPDDPHPR